MKTSFHSTLNYCKITSTRISDHVSLFLFRSVAVSLWWKLMIQQRFVLVKQPKKRKKNNNRMREKQQTTERFSLLCVYEIRAMNAYKTKLQRSGRNRALSISTRFFWCVLSKEGVTKYIPCIVIRYQEHSTAFLTAALIVSIASVPRVLFLC